jgi:ATP-dependent exoDNAse (exonuclease V) beta subunit
MTGLTERFTAEQLEAAERREGELFLDAAAGSGKTAVLVERFARAVLDDGIDVGAILTITFTEKAAAEMRDRIRARFVEVGAVDQARATEGAFISTIHGFCARLLRVHALAAGIDPRFSVLDENEAGRLGDGAFDGALSELAAIEGGVDLIAAYTPAGLRAAILGVYGQLRSRGEMFPSLPALGPAQPPDRGEVLAAGAVVAAELGSVVDPGARVLDALERLARLETVLSVPVPWPGDLDAVALPGGNGAALCTPACEAYTAGLARLRAACGHVWALRSRGLLDRLLREFGERYGALKRAASGLDFEDLELIALSLLRSDAALCTRVRERFAHVMVDELQDTNGVQLELVELVARGNLFTVGDAQQSIYGFRHADVALFSERGRRLEAAGARLSLATNFRARGEIINAIDSAFSEFPPMVAGREEDAADDPRVELLVVDKEAEWAGSDALAAPWRVAEARALAARVRALVDEGAVAGDVVVLTRATADLRVYERALEQHGIPTYVIGGRGYWSHPQVVDLVAYLRALANPRDEEALYTVLASPLVGVSADTLVLLAAAAREAGRDPWGMLSSGWGLGEFVSWFAAEREGCASRGVESLIERAMAATGYDLAVLAMPGGRRRMANIRKLMRRAREHEALHGLGLRRFLDLVARLGVSDIRESEAPVEGEALGAVRLMTIHRAKGLEFPVVCVADLGRGVRRVAPLIRVGADGRFGLKLAQPGTARKVSALAYEALADEQEAAEAAEERRLYYVAMTRAKERLIMSGAARLDSWPGGGTAIAWLGSALVPGIAEAASERLGHVTDGGVRVTFVEPREGLDDSKHRIDAQDRPDVLAPESVGAAPASRVTSLSYSSLAEYERCGYRFYVERVLGVPAVDDAPSAGTAPAGLAAADRGVLVHSLLERLDFRRPVAPDVAAAARRAGMALRPDEAADLLSLVDAFSTSDLCQRLAHATHTAREQRFSFLLGELLITGALDVLAREPGGRMLVVDYKSDRLEGADPADVVARAYNVQRLIYALAALRAGATEVEVVHVFLERPDQPVSATFADAAALAAELQRLAEGVLTRRFTVAETPHRAVCRGCPAEGGLCPWPLELTRREEPDRLF